MILFDVITRTIYVKSFIRAKQLDLFVWTKNLADIMV